MFENKAFKIEVIDKTESSQEIVKTSTAKDDVKELIIYAMKALATLIVIGGVVSTIGAILTARLS